MKLATFEADGAPHVGLVLGDEIIDLAAAGFASMRQVIDGGDEALAAVRALASDHGARRRPLSGVRLLPPLPDPPNNVYCVGRNYLEHVAEGDRLRGQETSTPEFPNFFTKTKATLAGPRDDIPYWSKATSALDYEVELAVILGRGGRDIPRAEAMAHVFGYAVANDVSARDLQRRHVQWFKGKSLDGSLPMGPWIVTPDEIGDLSSLELSLTVNGEERQRARVSQMIFDIPTILEHLSAGMTLSAGDVIITGTPAGVGAAMTPPHFLKDGDEVVAEISGIGQLRSRVKLAS